MFLPCLCQSLLILSPARISVATAGHRAPWRLRALIKMECRCRSRGLKLPEREGGAPQQVRLIFVDWIGHHGNQGGHVLVNVGD